MNKLLIATIALLIGLAGGYGLASVVPEGNNQEWETSTESLSDASPIHDMHETMDSMTSGLEDKTGAAFEAAFIDEMIVHHEGAVAMAKMVLEKSTRPELVKLANDIVAAQTSEIEMMQKWKADWF